MHLCEGGTDVAVLAGIDEIVVVGRAPNAAAHIAKDYEGKLLEHHLRGQRRGKALLRYVVAQVRWRPSLILVVARKGIAQVQNCRWRGWWRHRVVITGWRWPMPRGRPARRRAFSCPRFLRRRKWT